MIGSLYHSPLLALMIAINHPMNSARLIPTWSSRVNIHISGMKCSTTDTSRIATIHVDERGRFVVANAWDIQSDTSGYTSGRVIPSQWIYWFWPVRMDLLWFSRGADPALAPKGVAVVGQDRLKLRRVSARP